MNETTLPARVPEEPAVWKGSDVGLILLVFLFAIVIATLAVTAFVVRGPGRGVVPLASSDPRLMLLGQSLGFAAALAFAAIWLRRLYGVDLFSAVGWRHLPRTTVPKLMLTGIAMSIAIQMAPRFLPMPPSLPIDRMFTATTAWTMTVYGIAIAPLIEEVVFRGLIYGSLLRTFHEGMGTDDVRRWVPLIWATALPLAFLVAAAALGQAMAENVTTPDFLRPMLLVLLLAALSPLWLRLLAALFRQLATLHQAEPLAIAVTGVLFGLLHAAQLGYAWAPVLLLSIVGIVLTAVRAACRSVMASWIVHCFYNGTLFVLLFVGTHGYQNFSPLTR